jgi:hypothetical protein
MTQLDGVRCATLSLFQNIAANYLNSIGKSKELYWGSLWQGGSLMGELIDKKESPNYKRTFPNQTLIPIKFVSYIFFTISSIYYVKYDI